MAVTLIQFSVLSVALFLSSAVTTWADDIESSKFSYKGSKGPKKWGSLDPLFAMCSKGKSQSPIDIKRAELVLDKNLKPLSRYYYPANATLVNNGFNIGIHYDGTVGGLSLNGKNYTLKQMHWHSPSEHLIDGIQFKAELHLVHVADDGSASVVSVLYHYGKPDPLVAKIQNSLDLLTKDMLRGHEEIQIPIGTLNVDHIKRNTRKYYRYIGSLTTPPCTENVIWSILGKVRTISKEQVDSLKAPLHVAYKNNDRPVQPLDGRRVELYDELL